jgi:hypothetical protein
MHDQVLATTPQAVLRRGPVARPETGLHTVADVDALLARSRFFVGGGNLGKVVLHLPDLSPRETIETETRLNAAAHDCGCGVGAAMASVGLVLYVVFLFATLGSVGQWRLGHVLWGVVVCLACALAGKVTGLIRARVRLVEQLVWLKIRLQAGSQRGGY